MNGNAARFFRLGGGFLGLVALGFVLTGEAAKPARHGISLPTDWTHSHLIFSQPGTVEQAMRLQQDLRFEQQLYRRGQPLRLPATRTERDGVGSPQLPFPVRLPTASNGLWDESLGAGATVGALNFPAKFSFNSAVANCASATTPDFVVYSTGLTGSGTQASLIAYDNLYTGCTGASVPVVYWAYNTGGQILTSPVLSLDGTQLAFVQTAGAIGSLVLLKWAASATETVGGPGVPTSVPAASYATCVAPCMTSIVLQGGGFTNNDTTSSVFYDYTGDTIWVGDSRNWLHRFNPVFAAGSTPAEVGAPWPVQLFPTNATALASPVYDHGSGNVFVGDAGGYFYSVSAATGAVTKSSQLDHGTGIVAGPLVDSTAEVAYIFSSNDGSTACAGATPCAAVYRFAAGFAAGTAGAEATVGASAATPKSLYEGSLDSTYENSTTAAGNLYVCGHTGGDPTLYQVHITSGAVLSTVVTGPVLTTAATACSPVTDVLNSNATGGSTEFIFASVETRGTSTPCAAGGCIMNFKDTPWQPLTAYTLGQQIVDSNFHVQTVIVAGTSGALPPTWSTSLVFPANETSDGTVLNKVTWVNLGLTTAATPAAWVASHAYAVGNYIEDTNFNIEVVTAIVGNGHSKAGAHPTWGTTVGQATTDNHVTWTNAGPAPGALAAAGGTSGIIFDNTVETGVSGSQIYFSTQGNQATCGTATNVGCAVQASQSALK
jgi:hypothetical protein